MANSTPLNPSPGRIRVDSAGFKVKPKDAWEQYTHIYDHTPIADQGPEGFIQNQMWSTPSCLFGQQILSPGLYNHTAKHIRETEHLICVHRYLMGETYGSTDGHPFMTRPGMVTFRDMSQPYKGIQTAGMAQGIYFASDAIGYQPGRYSGMLTYLQNSTMGKVLHAEFDHFFEQFSNGVDTIEVHRLQRLIACLTVACAGVNAKEDVRAQAREALADLIRVFVEDNLGSPDLSVHLILKNFGVSRASLYRIFEPNGGVWHYISQRRLFRAALDLSLTATVRGGISRAAERWGFSSNANFHRSIKAIFGVKPGSLFQYPMSKKRVARSSARSESLVHPFWHWADARRAGLAHAS